MQEFFLAMPVLLISMVAHEVAHGYAALKQGDDTAQRLGRLTLNPVRHIDPWLTVLLPLMLWFGSNGQFVFGGAKPVPVDPSKYRSYRSGDIIVSSAGIVTNLLLFVAFVLLAMLIGVAGNSFQVDVPGLALLQRMMFWGIWLNLLLAFFNVIPILPLDGSHILYHLLPPRLAVRYRELSRFGFLPLLALIFFFPQALRIFLRPAFFLFETALVITRPFALTPFPT